jgi:hypothetical protein
VVRTILPTYIRDADHLMKELRLFSVDAIGMYSNIDTVHSIDVLTRWLHGYGDNTAF